MPRAATKAQLLEDMESILVFQNLRIPDWSANSIYAKLPVFRNTILLMFVLFGILNHLSLAGGEFINEFALENGPQFALIVYVMDFFNIQLKGAGNRFC